jgi:hypothetical protein
MSSDWLVVYIDLWLVEYGFVSDIVIRIYHQETRTPLLLGTWKPSNNTQRINDYFGRKSERISNFWLRSTVYIFDCHLSCPGAVMILSRA